MTFTFSKIQHIGIPVTNIKASEIFYKKLGFENVMETQFNSKGEKGKVMMMKKSDMIIEIYQLPETELAEIRTRKAGNIDHIAFDVADIDLAFHELKQEGYNVIEEAPVFLPFWKNGCKYFNISGPDGERLEFNQIL